MKYMTPVAELVALEAVSVILTSTPVETTEETTVDCNESGEY